MATELPVSAFEAAAGDARDKMRLDRRRILATLPRGKVLQDYLANVAEQVVDQRDGLEDMMLLVV